MPPPPNTTVELRRRLNPSVAAHRRLLRLIDAELRSLSVTKSSNLNHLETLARVLLHPSVRSVSRVAKPITTVHVDVACTLNGIPSWIFVSARNPRYVAWNALKARVERALDAAKAAGALRPAVLVFVFARGVVGDVLDGMVWEFGAARVEGFGGCVDEVVDGWVLVERGIGCGDEVVFQIRVDRDCGRSNNREFGEVKVDGMRDGIWSGSEVGFEIRVDEDCSRSDNLEFGEFTSVKVDKIRDGIRSGNGDCSRRNANDREVTVFKGEVSADEVFGIEVDGDCSRNEDRRLEFSSGEVKERKEVGCFSERFGSLVAKMDGNAVDSVNFDTTALIAMVSGISNGGCERLLKTPESEMRARFKGNYEFVMAQVMSELKLPILLEIEASIAGKKGIICESVLAEFKELTTMCGGPNEKRRAAELIKRLRIVPDCPSTRMMDLPTTRKIALKNKIVFGTGDHWHAPTLTANSGFVRAVSQTAMSLLTIEHRPRALTGD